MTLRAKFFIIFGVVILFIVFIILMLVRGSGNETTEEAPLTTTPVTPLSGERFAEREVPAPSLPSPTPSAPVRAPDAQALARSFTERFGSFSNQSNFENIRELSPLMTPLMQAWADRFIADAKAKEVHGAPYYGITTRAVQTNVKMLDERLGDAEIMVKTSRREVKGDAAPLVRYQDLVLTMKKIEGEWKVERASWK